MRPSLSWPWIFPVITLSAFAIACKASPQLFTANCKVDDEISTEDRESVGQVALKFVQDALGAAPSSAYAAFTTDAKESVSVAQFVTGFQNSIKPMGPFKDLHVAHTYLSRVTGIAQEQRVVCGSPSTSESWVAVNTKPGPAEAHVIVEGQTVNNTNAFVIWLIPEQGKWHVQYVHLATTAMVGKSPEDLLRIAATEHQKQSNFNAFILYATALQLADRGPFFQLGISPKIEEGMRDVPKPPILQGQAPFIWNLGKSTFNVLNVGAIGIGGKIYLAVDHEVEPWAADKVADQKNRELIMAFAQSHPEYKGVFAGLIVRAHERGSNRLFGTVDENQK